MPKLLRVALLAVIALVMLSGVVIPLASANTGPIEKIVLVVFGGVLVLAAVKVNRIGMSPTTR